MTLFEIIKFLADLATVLGIPVAIVIFINEKRQERREREYGTYDALDEKYAEYLRLCMANPELDLFQKPLAHGATSLTPEQGVRQMAMFEILVSLLERAFLMYRDQSSEIRRSQWLGWNEYMLDYARHPTFRRLWGEAGEQFDQEFTAHMSSLLLIVAGERSIPSAES